MFRNPFEALEQLGETELSNPISTKIKKHKAVVTAPRQETQNTSATSSPILLTLPLRAPTPAAHLRPELKDFPKEMRVIGNSDDPNDLAHRRTAQRLQDLLKATHALHNWLQEDIFFDEESLYRLEYEVIQVCEILLKLRENFKTWRYSKLIQDTLINGTAYSPVEGFRNMIVHAHVNVNDENRFEMYKGLATILATLHDFNERVQRTPLNFDDFLEINEETLSLYQKEWKREYTPKIQARLDKYFEEIIRFGQHIRIDLTQDHTQFDSKDSALLIPIVRSAEIIRQLRAKDSNVQITVLGKPLDPAIIPYIMQVRKGIHHYKQGFQPSSVAEIVHYATSLKPTAPKFSQN
jgi:uncharacterized protein YutE (UPF0331/DUF86 family)